MCNGSKEAFKKLSEGKELLTDRGSWDIDRVYSAVGKWITEAEYKEITGLHLRIKSNT